MTRLQPVRVDAELEAALDAAHGLAAADGRDRVSVEDLRRCVATPAAPTPVRVTPYVDGPYLVRGPVRITDQAGTDIEVSQRTVALCRCGKSQVRPFCDGTHKLVGFSAPSGAEGPRRGRPAPPGAGRPPA